MKLQSYRAVDILILTSSMVLTAAVAAQFLSLAVVALRLSRGGKRAGEALPPVSVIVPVCGLENHLRETLSTLFRLDLPSYEILFCVASPTDPAIPLIQRLMASCPSVSSQLLLGNDNVTANPKLNNLLRGWPAARHDWILAPDSNVLLPPNAVQRMLASWRDDTGLVCSPPAGSAPEGFAAELEAAFLDTYQARWQLFADETGNGFAQGKAMLLRKSVMEPFGGLIALASDPGEDGAATKLLRRHGLRVQLVQAPFHQPLGRRRFAEVWKRQLRWARLRRATFPLLYLPELLTGIVPAFAALTVLVVAGSLPVAALPTLAVAWYGGEALLAKIAGWPLGLTAPFAWLARDCLLPVLWIAGWGRNFVWRGNGMATGPAQGPLRGNAQSRMPTRLRWLTSLLN